MFHPCHQFGFLPGRSTIQQLLLFTFMMLYPVANKLILYSYLYFLKVFNSVSHGKLLLKLWLLGQGSMELVPVLSFEPHVQSICACILMVQYLSYYLFYLVCPGEYPRSCTFYNDLSLSSYIPHFQRFFIC